MQLKNSWEELPKESGTYFIINHCAKKKIYGFVETGAQWMDNGSMNSKIVCPSCERFQWIDMGFKDTPQDLGPLMSQEERDRYDRENPDQNIWWGNYKEPK